MFGTLSWDDLRVFRAVARSGSLSRAAEELSLTQPTIGRRLDRLENAVGVALVRRTTQGCTLTEAGDALLPHAEEMYAASQGLHRFANETHNTLSGVVRVATGDLLARYIARQLPRLVADAPELRLEVVTGMGFVSLERGDADLAIRNARPEGDAWVVRSLGKKPYAVYASATWLESHPESVEPERWASLRWIGFDSSVSVHSSRWLAATIGRPPDFAFSSSLHIVEAAASGAGLAALPLYSGDTDPRLVRVSPPLDALTFESFLVIHPGARRLPRVRWVAGRLADLLRTA